MAVRVRRQLVEAIDATANWMRDELISTRPASLGSYLAFTALCDFQRAVNFADQGLVANPEEFTLLNNKAVGLVQMGKVAEATKVFERTKLDSLEQGARIAWFATSGMLMFRWVMQRAASITESRLRPPKSRGIEKGRPWPWLT